MCNYIMIALLIDVSNDFESGEVRVYLLTFLFFSLCEPVGKRLPRSFTASSMYGIAGNYSFSKRNLPVFTKNISPNSKGTSRTVGISTC